MSGGVSSVTFILQVYAMAFVYALIVVIASAAYHAAVLREIAASIRLGGAQLALDVKAGALLGLTLTNLLIVLFSLGFLQPVAMARSAKFLIERLFSAGLAPLSDAHQAPLGCVSADISSTSPWGYAGRRPG